MGFIWNWGLRWVPEVLLCSRSTECSIMTAIVAMQCHISQRLTHQAPSSHQRRKGPQPALCVRCAGVLEAMGTDPSKPAPALARQRPATVSQTGRSEGQQCWWSSQQMASGSGQQAHVKQNPKNSRMQQQVLPAGHCVVSSQLTGWGPGGVGPGVGGAGGGSGCVRGCGGEGEEAGCNELLSGCCCKRGVDHAH